MEEAYAQRPEGSTSAVEPGRLDRQFLPSLARGNDALKVFEDGRGGRVVPPEPGDGYIGELGYMAECIEKGRAPRHVTAEDGVSAVEICEAEEESIRTGRPVALK